MVDKNETYLVLNYCSSPVAINTRHESHLIEKGSRDNPSSQLFTFDEILQINSSSPVFKIGLLRFEKEFEEDLYEELRIRDWKDILTDEELEDIILHPTIETLSKILAIENELYFERAYGVYIGLKNASYPITKNVETVMAARRKEFKNKKYKTTISLEKKKDEDVVREAALAEEVKKREALEEKLASMEAMIAKLTSSGDIEAQTGIDIVTPKELQKEVSTKKTTTKKTTNKKSSPEKKTSNKNNTNTSKK